MTSCAHVQAIAAHAKGLESISGERIWTEMFKILPVSLACMYDHV